MSVERVEAVYREVHARLWRSLFAHTGSGEVASDAEAEAVAQLLARGDAVEDPAAWVWRSAFRRTKTGKSLTDKDIAAVADDFEQSDFDPDDVVAIKKTRRRSPRIGDTNAEVVTFRAPASYKDRIKARADADATTESQVIRDALDAYL